MSGVLNPWRSGMNEKVKLIQESSNEVVIEDLEFGVCYFSRLRGLMFRQDLPPGKGLIMIPCSSIHTFFMRFPIDLVMIAKTGEVLKVAQNVKPWKMILGEPQTYAILEVKAGGAAKIIQGGRLKIHSGASGEIPEKARFLLP